jgi:hypothetical protein
VCAGDVDELGVAGDVPGRPDPGVVGAHPGVHQDLTTVAGLDTNGGKVQIVGDWTASGSNQYVLTAQLFRFAVRAAQGDEDGVVCSLHFRDCHAGANLDALVDKHIFDHAAGLRVLGRGQPVQDLHDRDLGSEPGEQLSELEPDGAAAEHNQRIWQLL